jgi:hypothetical protein
LPGTLTTKDTKDHKEAGGFWPARGGVEALGLGGRPGRHREKRALADGRRDDDINGSLSVEMAISGLENGRRDGTWRVVVLIPYRENF